jgi:hypothetical protein
MIMLKQLKDFIFKYILRWFLKIPQETLLEAKREYVGRFNLKPGLLDNMLSLMEKDLNNGVNRKEVLRKYFWH